MHFQKLKMPSFQELICTNENCPYDYRSSGIDGIGVFAKINLPKDFYLGKFLLFRGNGKDFGGSKFCRDELCRFMNHSKSPSVRVSVCPKMNFHAFTNRSIKKDEEIFIDYINVMDILDKKFSPFIIDRPVMIRTKKLIDFGRKDEGDAIDDMRKIFNGEWK